jgi:hypothetical protein
MADTSIQKRVESWVRDNVLAKKYGCSFTERHLQLTWGGQYKFDAVNKDGSIVANISSSAGVTNQGRSASGKIHKIKSDTLYLINVMGAQKRVQVFTEKTMDNRFQKEVRNGRYPSDIELLVVELPDDLQAEVAKMRLLAVKEVTPEK